MQLMPCADGSNRGWSKRVCLDFELTGNPIEPPLLSSILPLVSAAPRGSVPIATNSTADNRPELIEETMANRFEERLVN